MSEVAIEVDHVWKKFRKGEYHDSLRDAIPAMCKRLVGRGPKRQDLHQREFWAIEDVTFQVPRGESLGIIGPNGAGKSTMLKLLSRILRPNRGAYRVHGRLSALIEVGAGFHQDLTGRENIYLNGSILGMKRKEIRAKEEQIIAFAGIDDFIETPIKRYSSGMKARLGFAVAAHLDPDVLLVDEVLSVGDAKFRQRCIRHMQNLVDSDVTVIFISHILDQVRSLCPRTVVLDHGRMVYDGETEGAIKKYLDLLSDGDVESESDQDADAELRNVRLLNAEGKEVLQWQVRQPALVEADLVIHRPVVRPNVLMNLMTLGRMYLGTANSAREDQAIQLPNQPGTYRVRFTLDPLPLGEGDYILEFKIHDRGQDGRCLWYMPQGRTVSVRGTGKPGPIILCDGYWEVEPLVAEASAAAQVVGQP